MIHLAKKENNPSKQSIFFKIYLAMFAQDLFCWDLFRLLDYTNILQIAFLPECYKSLLIPRGSESEIFIKHFPPD